MAMSDSCADFLTKVGDAAEELAKAARGYAAWDAQTRLDADPIRRAAERAAATPTDPEAVALLARLARLKVDVEFGPQTAAETWAARRKLNELAASVPPDPDKGGEGGA